MKIGILGATEEEVNLITQKFENLSIEESAKRKRTVFQGGGLVIEYK